MTGRPAPPRREGGTVARSEPAAQGMPHCPSFPSLGWLRAPASAALSGAEGSPEGRRWGDAAGQAAARPGAAARRAGLPGPSSVPRSQGRPCPPEGPRAAALSSLRCVSPLSPQILRIT